jgi:pimeloyl-ACP methyl ester carboxylesterase
MDPVFLNTVQRFGLVLVAANLSTGCTQNPAVAKSARNGAEVATSGDGIQIVYEAYGDGTPALVFVHGWSCNRSYWRGQLQSFSRQFKVVAVDLAGHGESGLGREAWTMEAFGGDVAAVVEKLGLQRVILIGHSMGGDVIVAAARQLRGRVAGLVWIDAYKQLGTPRTPEQLQALLAPFRANFVEATRTFVRGMFPASSNRSLVERVAMEMSAAPPTVGLGALESAMSFDREVPRALQELKLPVVAINPDYRPTDVASMKRYGVEVVFMSGVGHFLMMEDPERFNRLLRTVIDKLIR